MEKLFHASEPRGEMRPWGILKSAMPDFSQAPITTPEDPRLLGVGQEAVAGADQIAARLAATPDERLDTLAAALDFIEEARLALRRAR